jgi:hypothetical protein
MSKKQFLKRSYAEVVQNKDADDEDTRAALQRSTDPFEAQAVSGESVIPPDWISGWVHPRTSPKEDTHR